MILTAILNLAFFLVSGLISFLPIGSGFSSTWHSAFISLGSYYHMLNDLLPAGIFFSCIVAIVLAEIGVYGLKTFKWIFSHLPFIGGSGN